MAQKRIQKDDIAPKNVFDNVTEGAKDAKSAVDMLEKSIEALKNTAKTIKGGLSGAKTGDVKSLKELEDLQRKANKTAQTKLQIDKKLLVEKEKLLNANKGLKAEAKDEAILTQKNLGTLQKATVENRKLRREREKLNLSTSEGNRRLRVINKTIDRNNKIIEKNSDRMKKQRLGIGRYQKAVSGLRGALGKLGLAFGAFSLIRDSFNVIADFQQAQANLASVLGVNTNEMAGLTEQAKELGATTRFTASQVSELQVELAKLGFTQQQIEDMTPATLALAEATGTELAEAAAVAGATLNGFGLSATDTQQVVDVMAKSFSSSSLDMEKFKVAMAAVAPVAKNAGFSIEETTALIGTLTDRGIDASAAGTGLRNMLLDSNKAGLTFQEALDKINNSADKTGTAFDLFGKRGATIGVILAENTNLSDDLKKSLDDLDPKELTSSLKELESITGDIGISSKETTSFIAALTSSGKSLEESTTGLNKVFEIAKKKNIDLNKALGQVNNAVDKGAKAQEIFGKAGADVVKILAENQNSVDKLTGKLEDADGAAKKMADTQRNTLGGALDLLRSAWEGFILSMDEAGSVGDTLRKGIVFLADNFNTIVSVLGKVIKFFVIYRTTLASIKLLDKIKDFRAFRKEIKQGGDAAKKASSGVKNFGQAVKGLAIGAAVAGVVEFAQGIWDIVSGAQRARIELKLLNDAVSIGAEKAQDFIDKNQKSLDSRLAQIKLLRSEQKITAEQQIELEKEATNRANSRLNAEIKRRTQSKKNAEEEIKDQKKLVQQLQKNFSFITSSQAEILELGKAKNALSQLRALRNGQVTAIKALTESRDQLNQTTVDLAIQENELTNETKKGTKAVDERTEAEKESISLRREILEERAKLIEDEFDRREEEAKLEASFRKEGVRESVAAEEEKAALIIAINKNLANELKKIDEDRKQAEIDSVNEMLDAVEEAISKDLPDVTPELLPDPDDVEEEAKKLKDIVEKFGNEVLDGLIERSKRKQSLIDEEIDKQQELVDALRSSAAEGNAIATQSLAREEELLEEKERQRRKEAKREIQLEEAKAVLNALNSFLDAGDSFAEATVKSIGASSVVKKLVAGLGLFKKGGYTGDKGTDEIAGLTHGQEFVIDAPTTSALGLKGADMDDFKNKFIHNAVMYEQLKGINAENTAYNAYTFDTSKLENKIEQLSKIVENKPETSIHPHIINGMAQGVEKRVKKGAITNKYIYLKK